MFISWLYSHLNQTSSAIVHGWRAELMDTLVSEVGAEVEVERLALEDIFLELHR